MPASPARTTALQPGPFVCYSRKDQRFVDSLVEALAAHGRDAWVDAQDIPHSADWWREIQGGIDAAPAVLVVLSPDAAASPVCAQEIAYATAQNKRLIPVVCREVDARDVAEPVRRLHWIARVDEAAPEGLIAQVVTAMDADLEWVRAHSRLLGRAAAWDEHGRDPGRLLRGAELDEFEHWLAAVGSERTPRPTALQVQYVLASGKAQTKRRRLALAGVSAALALSTALAGFAFVQSRLAEQQRNAALSRLFAAQALKNAGEALGRRDLALLQGVAALRLDSTDEARASLWKALVATDRVRAFVHTGATLLSVALHPHGRTIATGGVDGTVTLWDAQTLRPMASRGGDGSGVASIAFSPDGTTLATAGTHGLALLDAQTAALRGRIEVGRGGLSRLAWHPDGRTLFAAARADGTLHVVDATDPGRRSTVPVQAQGIRDIAISPDGRSIAIAAEGDPEVRLWDVATRTQRRPLAGHAAAVHAVAFSADGRLLASAGDDAQVRLWDTATGAERRVLAGRSGAIDRVAFSADGRWLAAGGDNRTVALWDLQAQTGPEHLTGHTNGLMDLVFSADSTALVSVAFDDSFIAWHLGLRRHVGRLGGHDGDVRALAVSADGSLLASGGADHRVRLWNLADGSALATLAGHAGTVRTLAFSPDGRLLASGSDDDRRITVWDLAHRQPAHQLDGGGEITSLEFSADGSLLASAAEGRASILLWDTMRFEQRAELDGHEGQVNTLAFSRDGRRLVSGGSVDQAVRVWDLAGRRQADAPRVTGTSVAQVAVDPDGTSVASSGHWPGGVLLWSLETAQPPRVVLEQGAGGGLRIVFSPDGRMLAHAAGEAALQIRLHGLRAQRLLAELDADATTLALAFTPDGRRLVSGHAQGGIVLWSAEVDRWPERACAIANRNLTRAEWRSAVGDSLPYQAPCPDLPVPGDETS